MLSTTFGWYVAKKFNAKFVSITFEETLAAGQVTNLSLADAIDGTALAESLKTNDLLITAITCRTTPGFIQVNIVPDNDSVKRFRIEATNTPNLLPISPPKHVQLDVIVECVNEAQPNNLYLTISAMQISQSKLPEFTLFAESIAAIQPKMFTELLNIRKLLENILAASQGLDPVWVIPPPESSSQDGKTFCNRGQ